MALNNVARSTAAHLARRSHPGAQQRAALSSFASTSACTISHAAPASSSSCSTSSSRKHRTAKPNQSRSNSTLVLPNDRASAPPAAAVPPVARQNPALYHALLLSPTSALASLSARLGLSSDDKDALEQLRIALTHPSWVDLRDKTLDDSAEDLGASLKDKLQNSRDRTGGSSNAQLATLGNGLLGMLASEHLHLQYPNLPTRVVKAALSSHVGPATLVDVAVEFGMGAKGLVKWDPKHQVAMTRGDKRPATSKDILAQAMRACVGLIFQTKGMAATRHFVVSHFLTRLPLPPMDTSALSGSASASASHPLAPLLKFNNPKRSLSMMMDKYGFERPQSRLIAETGRLTQAPVFGVGVYSGSKKVGEGWGSALKMAEYRAAEDALRRLYLRKAAPLSSDEIPSATLDAEWTGAEGQAALSSQPLSAGKDIWAVGEDDSTVATAASKAAASAAQYAASAAATAYRPRRLGESELAYDNKR